MEWYFVLLISLLCLIVGVALGVVCLVVSPRYKEKKAQHNADKLLNDAQIKAEHIIKNAELDAKQATFDMKQEADKDIKERKQEVVAQENKLLQREQSIDQRDAALIQKESALAEKSKQIVFETIEIFQQ